MVKVTTTDCDACGSKTGINNCVFCGRDVCLQCSQSIFGGMGVNRYYCTSHLSKTPMLPSDIEKIFQYEYDGSIRYGWKQLKKFQFGWLIIVHTHEDGIQFLITTSRVNAEHRVLEYHLGGGDNSETTYSVYHQGRFYSVKFETTVTFT